jgi:uncharacterized Zn finger protein
VNNSCRKCDTCEPRYSFAFAGVKGKFIRYLDLTTCRNCGYEWMDPIHFVHRVAVTDYMRVCCAAT